jgi:hypothetical protein
MSTVIRDVFGLILRLTERTTILKALSRLTTVSA